MAKEVNKDWQTENYIPSRRQALQYQDNYRNISVGFIPFMPLFRLNSNSNIADSMRMHNLETEGDTSGYFEWAPNLRGKNIFEQMSGEGRGAGQATAFQESAEEDYMSNALYPYISWLYGGDLASVSLYARAMTGKKEFINKGKDNWPVNIPQKDMSKFIGKGIAKGETLRNNMSLEPEQADRLFGGQVDSMQDLIDTVDNIVGTKDGVTYKFKKTGFFKDKPFIGSTGGGKAWSPTLSVWQKKAQALSKILLDDIIASYKPDDDSSDDGDEEDSLYYVGEAMEENALSLLMERAEELNPNFTLNRSKDRQMTSNTAGEFDLPDEISKTASGHIRKAVDIDNKSREGDFLHQVAELDNDHARDLKKLLSLDKDLSIGTELTLFDIRQKGGYKTLGKMGKDLGSVNNPLKSMAELKTAIHDVNKEQVTIIEKYLEDAGNDVQKAAKSIETDVAAQRKKLGKKLTGEYHVADQARQTLVRFVDTLHPRNVDASGFNFTSRFSVYASEPGKDAIVQNGAVGFSWLISGDSINGYTVTPNEPEIIQLQGDITNVLDMVGAALMGSDTAWVEYRKSTFMKDLVNEVAKDATIDGMLYDKWLVQAASSQSWSVSPEVRTSYKVPTAIAGEIAQDIKKKISKETQAGSEFMKTLESDMKILSEDWHTNLQTDMWKGSKQFIQDQPSFFTPKGNENVEAWALPHMVGGKAGALSKPGSSSKWYRFTEV